MVEPRTTGTHGFSYSLFRKGAEVEAVAEACASERDEGLRALVRAALLALTACLLAACTRTVEWDEEVLLNTGEKVWVHRTANYRWGNSTPVASRFGYEFDRRNTIAFEYRGQRYSHETDGLLQVLAVSPQGIPNLVISAADDQWQWEHDYRCTRPSYVQLQPDAAGTAWHWPPDIEPWLYDLPTNLLVILPMPGEKGTSSVDISFKERRNDGAYGTGPHMRRIDPQYQSTGCKRR